MLPTTVTKDCSCMNRYKAKIKNSILRYWEENKFLSLMFSENFTLWHFGYLAHFKLTQDLWFSTSFGTKETLCRYDTRGLSVLSASILVSVTAHYFFVPYRPISLPGYPMCFMTFTYVGPVITFLYCVWENICRLCHLDLTATETGETAHCYLLSYTNPRIRW